MTKKTKKGFTLTELIVVIAIIAILAAVLIPTSISFIKKAKKSNDVQLAGQMTKEIGYYCVENDIDQNKLLGTDIRSILLFKEYTLIPRTNDWTFVYNAVEKKVEVIELSDELIFASDEFDPKDPTNYDEQKFLLGKGKSNFEKAVNILCNLTDVNEYTSVIEILNDNQKNIISKFNPTQTLYLTNSLYKTSCDTPNGIKKIVYLEKTVNIPFIDSTIEGYIDTNAYSIYGQIVKTAEKGSFILSYIKKINEIEKKNVMEIDMSNFDLDKKIIFGSYVNDSLFIDFNIIEINRETILDESIYTIKTANKLIVSCYNEKGLFARGEKVFISIQEINSNN